MKRLRNLALLLTAVLLPLHASGYLPPWLIPITIQPWVPDEMVNKYCGKDDFRTPILPPIRDGVPEPTCEDPPTPKQVLRVMPRITRGIPYVYEEFRDDIKIVTERIKDTIDPPRFYPLVGPARLHHCHY